jgi:hypothetical protein
LLGRSLKNRTDRYVIDGHLRGGTGLLKIVCGESDNSVRAEYAPRRVRRQVVLPQVNTIGVQRQGDIYPVIYDYFYSAWVRETQNLFCFPEELDWRKKLFTQLNEVDATFAEMR